MNKKCASKIRSYDSKTNKSIMQAFIYMTKRQYSQLNSNCYKAFYLFKNADHTMFCSLILP